MNSIVFSFEDNGFKDRKKEIKAYLERILKHQNLSNVEFSVTFTGKEEMHKLNFEYRGIDDSTDILSFAVEDETDGESFVLPEGVRRNLGDMIICPEVMRRNAAEFSVSEEEELRRLLIHGVLHLSGHNHETNDMSEPMLVLQENILRELGSI